MIAVGMAGQNGRLRAAGRGDSRRWADFWAIFGVGIFIPWGKLCDQLEVAAVGDLHDRRG